MTAGARRIVAAGVAAVAAAACGAAPAAAAPSCPWVSSRAPIHTRVTQVLGRMTEADKLDLVAGLTTGVIGISGPVYVGQTTPVPSLCIPALNLEDGPAGVGDSMKGVTQLPAPVALAATWDPRLARAYGTVVGTEQRGKGTNVDLGPTVNIVRDPRWGRAFETFGEDPLLQGVIGVGYIDGVQSQGVMAQVKHLVAYDEESARDSAASNSIVSERALQEIYLPPFQAAIDEAHVSSIMCSYNEVNDVPACQSGYSLDQVLHAEFGFSGFVTSDWFATHSSAPSADAGLDMQMPDGCYFTTGLKEALHDGQVPGSRLNDMVSRILGQMFRFHLFGRATTGTPGDRVTTPAHLAAARRIAEAGTVLLKNADHLLPLSARTTPSIAVIGADAGSRAYSGGGGSASVVPSSLVTPFQGIAARAGRHISVTYDDGANTRAAAASASHASAAIVFADLPESEGQDLSSIDLPAQENTLIADVAAANPHTIVVLNTGSAVAMPWLSSVPGVLEAWYPGEQDGSAIAAVLFGDVDPGGKLPVTFPTSLSQEPTGAPGAWPSLGRQVFSEGPFVGYRYFAAHDETPLFPFGYGLSYTAFRIAGGHVSRVTRAGRAHVSVTVTNTGRRTGSDVIQLYVGDPASAGEPPRQLEAFRRVTLRPHRHARITFTLSARSLSHWNGRWVAPAGTYRLLVGDSSVALPVRLRLRLHRAIRSGRPVGSAPHIGTDSALLDAQCLEDTGAPLVTAGSSVLPTLP